MWNFKPSQGFMYRHVFYLFLHLWFLSIQRFIIFVVNIKLHVLVNFATEGGQKTSVHKLNVCPFILLYVCLKRCDICLNAWIICPNGFYIFFSKIIIVINNLYNAFSKGTNHSKSKKVIAKSTVTKITK